MHGSNGPQIDSLIKNIGTLIEKLRFYGMKFNFIFGLLHTTRVKCRF